MSYNLIKEGLEKVKKVTSWNSLLIKYKHKTHPNEFTCHTMNFSTAELLTNIIEDMCIEYLEIIDKLDGKVVEYTGCNPKGTIDKLSTTNDLISESWNSLIQHINDSDDTQKLKDIKANAFVFVGTYPDDNVGSKNIYMLTRKNPILTFKKRTPTFTSKHNTITEATEPLVQFSKRFDALIYNDTVYMINSNCETIFNMEYSHKNICHKCLDELGQSNLIKNMDAFRQFATAGQTPKKFFSYDQTIVSKLKESKWQNQISQDFKIPFNSSTKQFDLSDIVHANNFTLVVCGKTKNNMFDNGICEVPTSTPISLA